MALFLCDCTPSDPGTSITSYIKDIGPTIVAVITIIVSYILSRYTANMSERQNLRTLNSKKLEEQRNDIRKKLDEFYGPIIQLRKKSNILYQKFSEELRRLNKDFATLPYLLGGGKLTANEEMLLKEIIAIGVKTETLIHEKAGLIDVPELRLTLIPRATSHFLMMRLAYNRTIVGEADKFRDLTFPRELDERLEKRKKELEDELKSLNTPSDFV